MQRPEIRIIQNQEEQTKPANIDSWEAEQLLRKYGHQPQQFSTREESKHIDNGLTFEQMVAQQEARLKEEELRKQQRRAWNLAEDDVAFLFTGRLSRQKRIKTLITSFASEFKNDSKAHLFLF